MTAPSAEHRDFESISPSARALLFLKGHTDIPLAREGAALLAAPEPFLPDMDNQNPLFWGRVLHFEARYWSLDALLSETSAERVLELSSGFSFRGLDRVRRGPCHYLDTDLPAVTAPKRALVDALEGGAPPPPGRLEIISLNALDEEAFAGALDHFAPGELVILNEGLLMYLDEAEKVRLCGIIRRALLERGGCWITGDIYIRRPGGIPAYREEPLRRFAEEHGIEEKKFSDFGSAERFFRDAGLAVEARGEADRGRLSALPRLLAALDPWRRQAFENRGPAFRQSWRLRPLP